MFAGNLTFLFNCFFLFSFSKLSYPSGSCTFMVLAPRVQSLKQRFDSSQLFPRCAFERKPNRQTHYLWPCSPYALTATAAAAAAEAAAEAEEEAWQGDSGMGSTS